MGKKKAASATPSRPRSFGGLLRGHAKSVREIAQALRDLVYEELPDAEETFYGGRHAMAMYRTTADICWIQPLKQRPEAVRSVLVIDASCGAMRSR